MRTVGPYFASLKSKSLQGLPCDVPLNRYCGRSCLMLVCRVVVEVVAAAVVSFLLISNTASGSK